VLLRPPHTLPLPQRGSLPTGCSLSGTGCSSVGPPWGHKLCQQTCSGVGSSLHGFAGPARSLPQRGLPTGSQLPLGIHLLRHGVPSTGYRWISAPLQTSKDCRETTASPQSSSQVAREGSLLRHLKHLLPPTSSLTLMSAKLFLSHRLTPLSSLPFHRSFFSSPSSLCYHRGATTIADGFGLGQQCVHLRAGWHWLYQRWGKFLATSHRSHPYNPPAIKTLPHKPITFHPSPL